MEGQVKHILHHPNKTNQVMGNIIFREFLPQVITCWKTNIWSNIWRRNFQASGETVVPFTVRPPNGVGGGSSSWELTPVPGLNKPLGVFKKSRMSLYNVQVEKLSKCTLQILDNTTLMHWIPFYSNHWKFEESNIIKNYSTQPQFNVINSGIHIHVILA